MLMITYCSVVLHLFHILYNMWQKTELLLTIYWCAGVFQESCGLMCLNFIVDIDVPNQMSGNVMWLQNNFHQTNTVNLLIYWYQVGMLPYIYCIIFSPHRHILSHKSSMAVGVNVGQSLLLIQTVSKRYQIDCHLVLYRQPRSPEEEF